MEFGYLPAVRDGMAAAAVVFVIACSNVTNLILARSRRRGICGPASFGTA